jgi:hypothetical protein
VHLGVIEHTLSQASRDHFLGHIFTPFPLHSTCAVPLFSYFSSISYIPNPPNHHHPPPTTTSLIPPHHHTSALPPPSPSLPFPFFLIVSHFLKQPISPTFLIVFHIFLLLFKGTHGLCVPLCWIVIDFAGGWVWFKEGFETLVFRSAHQVFDKIPQPAFKMPRGQASSSRSYGTQAIAAKPTFQSRKLILETSFAIKKDFTNFEATRWAIQELKHCGLK